MKKITVLLAALLLVLVACSEENSETEEQDRETTVEIAEVSQGNMSIDKSFYGRTSPIQATPVMVPMAGEVDSIDVSNGDQVEEDDELLTIIAAETGRTITLSASGDGEVTGLSAKEGDMISTEAPVATIADLTELTLEITVTSNNLSLFEADQEVSVQFADEAESVTATVDYVSALPNDSGLHPVTLTVDNADEKWRAGAVAEVIVAENTVEDTLIVPTAALVEEDDATFVYVVHDEMVTKTEITVTDSQTDKTAIDGDLAEGDQVVVSGQLTLADGAKVSIADGEDNES